MTPNSSMVRKKSHRMISSKYPTVGVFDDLTKDPNELRVAFILEGMSSGKKLNSISRIKLLPNDEIMSGPSASLIMAAFLYANDNGGRFTDEKLGAWYASSDTETSIHETLYHHHRRLACSENAFPNRMQMREYTCKLQLKLIDIRGMCAELPQIYTDDHTQYAAAQEFANQYRWPSDGKTHNGIAYDSVRNKGGENYCIFWPSAVPRPITQADHYEYVWDFDGKVTINKLTNVQI